MGGYKESFSSILCFGCLDVYSQGSLGMDIHVSDLNLLTRRKLSRLLDPPDPMGKDWCLLAMNLGLPDLVAKYNTNNGTQNDFLSSPVHALLREWSNAPESTVGILMSKLRELGRRDAADFLLKASSVFKINLDANGQEAYASSCNSVPFAEEGVSVGLNDPAGVTRTRYLCFTEIVCMLIIASGACLLIFPLFLRHW
uniref:Death domain-containing protein n=1 Tax=Pavo cristatus TaxID=9049 RepID=A0A8C9F5Z5_PAVCR